MRSLPRMVLERYGILPVMVIVVSIVYIIWIPQFFTASNMLNVVKQSVYLILATMGQSVIIIVGCVDLSVGPTISLASISTAKLILASSSLGGAAAMTIGSFGGIFTGILVGLVNGLIVGLFRVPPFLVTIGTMYVAEGITYLVSSGMPVYGLPSAFHSLGASPTFLFAICGFLVFVVVLLMEYTVTGRFLYAVGGNERASRTVGILAERYWLVAYLIGGALFGLTAVLLTARVSSGEPMLGRTLTMECIAATILGGVSITGGSGRVLGAVIAAVFLRFFRNGMDLMNVSSYLQVFLMGLIIIVAVIANQKRYSSGGSL